MGATTTVNPLVAQYVSEREGLVSKVEMLTELARDRGKDPSDEDLESIRACKQRIKTLDNLIDTLGDDLSMDEEVQTKIRRTNPGLVPQIPKYRTAGELMWDTVQTMYGRQHSAEHRDAKQRYEMLMKRTADHMGTDSTLTVPTAGDLGGLTVDPVVGPIIDLSPAGQPFLAATKQQAPNALSFLRPTLEDPDFLTGASAQGLQKAELVSKKFDITSDTVTMETVGGYLNVSQQLLSISPQGWNIILRQLQRRVGRQGELKALTALALSNDSVSLATGADAETTWQALVEACRKVAVSTLMPASWIAYGPYGWERLVGTVDDMGRPLFPNLGASNAGGTASVGDENVNLPGLRPIYTTGISDASIWIGNSLCFEAYSFPFPVLEAVEPSVLGRQVAVAEALGFYRPVANGAVKVGPA